MNHKALACFLLFPGLCIMVASCFSVVTILYGSGFGALLVIAGILKLFSPEATSPHVPSGYGSREDFTARMPGFSDHRPYGTDEVVVTSVVYGDFDIVLTRSPVYGHGASIHGFADRDIVTVGGYPGVAEALQGARDDRGGAWKVGGDGHVG